MDRLSVMGVIPPISVSDDYEALGSPMEILLVLAFAVGFLLGLLLFQGRKKIQTEDCPRCLTRINPANPCSNCGWDLGGRLQRQATRRVIEGLRREGKINAELQQLILTAFDPRTKSSEASKSPESPKASIIVADVVVSHEDPSPPERSVPKTISQQELSRERGKLPAKPVPNTSPKDPPHAKPGSEKLETAATASVIMNGTSCGPAPKHQVRSQN